MEVSRLFTSVRLPLLGAILGLFLAACGGSSGGAPDVEQPASTGTFGLFVTDKPSEDFAEINLYVISAVLIGGDDGQQVLFETEPDSPRQINLLDLRNFNKPLVFSEVPAGTYTKLRLVIQKLDLVPFPTDADPTPAPIPVDGLPANGKIDLLDQDGFDVESDGTLVAEVDIDANKSIKVTGTGNDRKYQFRPVVKVQFSSDGAEQKLTRLEGFVNEPLVADASFALCSTETGDNCVDVLTDPINTSFFDIDGAPIDLTGVALGLPVVVIGLYQFEPDVVLNAVVVEIDSAATQVRGEVVTDPLNEPFLLLAEDDSDLKVDLQENTKYFNAEGEVDVTAVLVGANVEIEGVLADTDRILAALVFVEDREDDQLSGTINGTVETDVNTGVVTFDLLLGDGATVVMVTVADEPDILLVDEVASVVTEGSVGDLADGQSVDLFGETQPDSMFFANEIIVEVTPLPAP